MKNKEGGAHLDWALPRSLSQYALLPLVLVLRRPQTSELVGGGSDQLYLHSILQTRLRYHRVASGGLLSLVQELLVLWGDGGELFEAVMKVCERSVGEECERMRGPAMGENEVE